MLRPTEVKRVAKGLLARKWWSHVEGQDSVPSGVLGVSEGHGHVLLSPPGLCPWYLVSWKVMEIILRLVVRGPDLNVFKLHRLSWLAQERLPS